MTNEGAKTEKAGVGFDRRDAVGLAGLVLLGVGCGLIFLPAGLIVPGAVLAAVAIFGVRG